MRKIILLLPVLVTILSFQQVYAQSDSSDVPDRDWRIEIEPSSFTLRGFSFHIGKNVTKDNRLNVSLYTAATDIPSAMQDRIFSNLDIEDKIRVGLQLASVVRYKFNLSKGKETNPYVGLITGWEYFTVSNSMKQDLRVDVMLLTPYVGYEIYLYKKMLYLNPQFRSVIYLNPKYSNSNRVEKVNKVFFLPQLSIGVRL